MDFDLSVVERTLSSLLATVLLAVAIISAPPLHNTSFPPDFTSDLFCDNLKLGACFRSVADLLFHAVISFYFLYAVCVYMYMY